MANAVPVPELFCDDSCPHSGDDLTALCGAEPDGPAWSIAESKYFAGGHMLACTGISGENIKEIAPDVYYYKRSDAAWHQGPRRRTDN